jgi:hypothetical protein
MKKTTVFLAHFAYAATILGRFMQNIGELHMTAAKTV